MYGLTGKRTTASAVGPCPALIQIRRTLRHWKFTQHRRTTRLPPTMSPVVDIGKSFLSRSEDVKKNGKIKDG